MFHHEKSDELATRTQLDQIDSLKSQIERFRGLYVGSIAACLPAFLSVLPLFGLLESRHQQHLLRAATESEFKKVHDFLSTPDLLQAVAHHQINPNHLPLPHIQELMTLYKKITLLNKEDLINIINGFAGCSGSVQENLRDWDISNLLNLAVKLRGVCEKLTDRDFEFSKILVNHIPNASFYHYLLALSAILIVTPTHRYIFLPLLEKFINRSFPIVRNKGQLKIKEAQQLILNLQTQKNHYEESLNKLKNYANKSIVFGIITYLLAHWFIPRLLPYYIEALMIGFFVGTLMLNKNINAQKLQEKKVEKQIGEQEKILKTLFKKGNTDFFPEVNISPVCHHYLSTSRFSLEINFKRNKIKSNQVEIIKKVLLANGIQLLNQCGTLLVINAHFNISHPTAKQINKQIKEKLENYNNTKILADQLSQIAEHWRLASQTIFDINKKGYFQATLEYAIPEEIDSREVVAFFETHFPGIILTHHNHKLCVTGNKPCHQDSLKEFLIKNTLHKIDNLTFQSQVEEKISPRHTKDKEYCEILKSNTISKDTQNSGKTILWQDDKKHRYIFDSTKPSNVQILGGLYSNFTNSIYTTFTVPEEKFPTPEDHKKFKMLSKHFAPHRHNAQGVIFFNNVKAPHAEVKVLGNQGDARVFGNKIQAPTGEWLYVFNEYVPHAHRK